MSVVEIVLATAGLYFAGVVKGATGLGYASCALPFLVATIGLAPAMAIVLVPAMATNVSVAFATGHLRETLARFLPLYVSLLPGIAGGVFLLGWVRGSAAAATLGLCMVLYAVFALAKPSITIPVAWQRPLQWPVGFLNGIVTGLTGSQVMPLFPYVMGLNLDPSRTVQAINLTVMIASVVLAIGLAMTGIMTGKMLAASIIATLPALAGVETGTRVRQLVSLSHFRTMILLVLLLMGLGMILRA
jgi:uncharacterized protein